MDPLSIIAGAVVLAVGFGSGRASGYLHGKRAGIKESKQPPKPICGCGHSAGYHKDKAGKCTGVDTTWDDFPKHCTCQNYDGPEPLTTLYAPGITEG